MKPLLLPITLLLLLLSWGTAAADSVARFEADLQRVRREIADPALFNPESCAAYLERGTRFLYANGARSYVPRQRAERERLRQQAPQLLRRLFELRLALLERLRAFHRQGEVAGGCVDGVRRALRYARFIEESIAEFQVQGREAELPALPLQGGEPSLMINPAFGSAALRSGDVLLVRGPSFVDATIARIGDEDGQFNHVAMFHLDVAGGRWVMEAQMSRGVMIVPLQEWLGRHRIRLLVLRHRDADLAARASEQLYHWIREVQAGGGITPYDYQMDESSHSEMFCAELVAYAFEQASGGRERLPQWRTSLRELMGTPLLETLGIASATVFAPADVELDPRLRLVAEWRDLRETADTRINDAILSSILEWMARDGYRLTYRGLRQGALEFYWEQLRPKGVLASKVPAGMTLEFLKAVVGLKSVAGLIHARVTPVLDSDPLALDYKVVRAQIEAFRRRDCQRVGEHQRWREHNPVAFGDPDEPPAAELHRLIAPPEGVECPLPTEGGE